MGGRETERKKKQQQNLKLKRWTQISFRYYLKINSEIRGTTAKTLLAKVNDRGCETCVASRPLVPEAILLYQSQEYRIGTGSLTLSPGDEKRESGS